jgi:hypothetical protein
MKEIFLVRDTVLKAHREYNLIKQRYEEKQQSISVIKKELEQNAYNRSMLLESTLENLKISRQTAEEERELLERNYIYQIGYIIGGNLTDETLKGTQYRFEKIAEELQLGGGTDGGAIALAEAVTDAERYLDRLLPFFEPFYYTEFAPFKDVMHETCDFVEMLLKHRGVKVKANVSEVAARTSVCRDITKISAAIACVLIKTAVSISENPVIEITVTEASGDEGERRLPHGFVNSKFIPNSETECAILITFKVTSSKYENAPAPSTKEGENPSVEEHRAEKLAKLAGSLPIIVQVLLKGSFSFYESKNGPAADIRIG